MSATIRVRLDDDELSALDAGIERGAWPSRSAALRAGLRLLLRDEDAQLAAKEYRRAYADPRVAGESDAVSAAALSDAED